MVKAPKPANEDARLKDLQSFEILDTENEKDYDGLVELVSLICECPMAIVNFIDSNRQWFKASKNMNAREASRDESFCGHAIMNNDVFVISDATKDERFFDNPDVKGGLHVRFYAGAPIVSPNGYNLGTVCAIDSQPKYLSSFQVTALKTIAEQVSRLLELRMKNKQILQTATDMVITQKKMAQLNMKDRESQEYRAAMSLHNEMNQAVAAVRHYVEKAKTDQSNSGDYINASVEELNQLIENISALSNNIAPVSFTNDNFRSHIEKLVKDFERKERVNLRFSYNDTPQNITQEKGSMIYRIIQDLLRFASQSESRNVGLAIQNRSGLDIVFEYDTKKLMLENQKMLLQDNIMNRVDILGGQYEKSRFDTGERRIHINIP